MRYAYCSNENSLFSLLHSFRSKTIYPAAALKSYGQGLCFCKNKQCCRGISRIASHTRSPYPFRAFRRAFSAAFSVARTPNRVTAGHHQRYEIRRRPVRSTAKKSTIFVIMSLGPSMFFFSTASFKILSIVTRFFKIDNCPTIARVVDTLLRLMRSKGVLGGKGNNTPLLFCVNTQTAHTRTHTRTHTGFKYSSINVGMHLGVRA